jgi:hypothetical protein
MIQKMAHILARIINSGWATIKLIKRHPIAIAIRQRIIFEITPLLSDEKRLKIAIMTIISISIKIFPSYNLHSNLLQLANPGLLILLRVQIFFVWWANFHNP